MSSTDSRPLAGASVLITRPAGQGRALARRVQALGGRALLLPGVSLRPMPDAPAARAALRHALDGDMVVFTSPAAVRFAAALAPLEGPARVATVGRGTARALHHHGVDEVLVPAERQDSEGLLAHPAMADLRGMRVAVVGAPGGRGVLQSGIREHGADMQRVHVYRRVPARLDARHVRALRALRLPAYILLSSAETLACLERALQGEGWRHVRAAHAVVSSGRIERMARASGFRQVAVAGSALGDDLLRRVVELNGL